MPPNQGQQSRPPPRGTGAGGGAQRPTGPGGVTQRGRRPGTHGSGISGQKPPSGERPPVERTGPSYIGGGGGSGGGGGGLALGFTLFAVGYALFYWGLHHMPGTKRYSLTQLLGLTALFPGVNVQTFQNVQLGAIQGKSTLGASASEALGGTAAASGAAAAAGGGGTSAQTTAAQTGGTDQQQFTSALLSAIGAPNTPTNQAIINAWMACESAGGTTPAGAYNYLNMKDINGNFMSFNSASAAGTAAGQRLVGAGYSAYGYNSVVNALQQQNASAFGSATGLTKWGTSNTCVQGVLGGGVTVA